MTRFERDFYLEKKDRHYCAGGDGKKGNLLLMFCLFIEIEQQKDGEGDMRLTLPIESSLTAPTSSLFKSLAIRDKVVASLMFWNKTNAHRKATNSIHCLAFGKMQLDT